MAEYIEREAVMKKLANLECQGGTNREREIGEWLLHEVVPNSIREMPAADVVEVVRCKGCKHWNNGHCWGVPFVGDDASYVATEETDYCSYGEAKMDGKGE